MKLMLSEPGKQKLERQNCCYCVSDFQERSINYFKLQVKRQNQRNIYVPETIRTPPEGQGDHPVCLLAGTISLRCCSCSLVRFSNHASLLGPRPEIYIIFIQNHS